METQIVKEKIPEVFSGKKDMKGITFTLIKRTENVVLYELDYHDNMIKYEVVKVKLVNKVDWDSGKRTILEGQFKEVYPNSEQFGPNSWAWAFSDKEKALIKFDLINSRFTE